MRKNWIWFALAAAAMLLVGGVLNLIFRDWVRDNIAYPISYIFWVVRLLVLSIPQSIIWGIVILAAIMAALYINWPSSLPERAHVSVHRTPPASRYSTWLRYIRHVETSRFANDNLARDLVRLTVQILADQQHLTTDEVYKQIEHHELTLPDQLTEFLQRRGFVNQYHEEPRLVELFHRVFPPPRRTRPPGVYSPAELEASQIIAHIEGLFRQPEKSIEELLNLEENR